MALIDELARVVDPAERASGARSLAQLVGATHLCIFIRDPDLDKFLPAPGFPQTLPDGIAWSRFLQSTAQSGSARAQLRSPFSPGIATVSGCHLDKNAIAVLFGEHLHPGACATLNPGLRMLAALCVQEVKTNLAHIDVSLSRKTAMESRQLASALSKAHDMLAEALHTRESLLSEIRTRDERLRLVRHISGIGTWEFREATQQVRLSPETCAIYGMPAEEFTGDIETIFSRIHEEDRQHIRDALNTSRVHGGDYNVQFRVVWPSGVIRWIEARGMVMRDSEDANFILLGFSLDVTQRILTEEALIRTEKLAAAGRLAASIAHEINNPLEALVNIVYLAKSDPDLDRVRELLALADDELARVSSVARQALGFYRDTNTPVEFDAVSAIRRVLDVFNKQIQDAGVTLKTRFTSSHAEVLGWPGEIKQALSNLLINAIHATPPAGVIHVRVRRSAKSIFLTIADTGHGITPEHRPRIFEPFFSTKKDSGTGLGLWVTRQVIEKHGGSIRVRSKRGAAEHGTVFLLCLPVDGHGRRFRDPEQHMQYRSL